MQEALKREIDAYDAQRDALASEYGDKWVIFKGGEFVKAFDSYDSAVTFGLKVFGEQAAYLLRQIEDRQVSIPMLLIRE